MIRYLFGVRSQYCDQKKCESPLITDDFRRALLFLLSITECETQTQPKRNKEWERKEETNYANLMHIHWLKETTAESKRVGWSGKEWCEERISSTQQVEKSLLPTHSQKQTNKNKQINKPQASKQHTVACVHVCMHRYEHRSIHIQVELLFI